MVTCGNIITDPNICSMLFNTVFPWIFSFAIFYGLLIKSEIFGGADKPVARGVSGIIGIVAGFLIVVSFGPAFGAFLASVSGTIVMFASVIIGIVMLFTIINPDLLKGKGEFSWAKLSVVAAIILIAGAIISGYSWPTFTFMTFGTDLLALAIILIIIGVLVWFVTATGGGGTSEENKTEKQKQAGE